jgi:hypothetical protein
MEKFYTSCAAFSTRIRNKLVSIQDDISDKTSGTIRNGVVFAVFRQGLWEEEEGAVILRIIHCAVSLFLYVYY